MTPTEARELAGFYADAGRQSIALLIETLANQIEALEGQALSSVEREEYFAMKKDAERYRWLRAHHISGPMHDLRWLLPRDCSLDGDGLDAAIDREREAT